MTTARESLVALHMVGRNFREMQDFGRVLTDGERKEVARLEEISREEGRKGAEHARNGGKMKHNPHEAGSLEWWSWHEGYKTAKSAEAAAQRRQQRGNR